MSVRQKILAELDGRVKKTTDILSNYLEFSTQGLMENDLVIMACLRELLYPAVDARPKEDPRVRRCIRCGDVAGIENGEDFCVDCR